MTRIENIIAVSEAEADAHWVANLQPNDLASYKGHVVGLLRRDGDFWLTVGERGALEKALPAELKPVPPEKLVYPGTDKPVMAGDMVRVTSQGHISKGEVCDIVDVLPRGMVRIRRRDAFKAQFAIAVTALVLVARKGGEPEPDDSQPMPDVDADVEPAPPEVKAKPETQPPALWELRTPPRDVSDEELQAGMAALDAMRRKKEQQEVPVIPSQEPEHVEEVEEPPVVVVDAPEAGESEVALTTGERVLLTDCEKVIERGLKTFIEVGTALADIRDGRLYRETYPTFEAYCEERWGFTRQRAHQIVSAAEVAGNLSTIVDTPAPANEAQARELVKLTPDDQRAAWKTAVETAPEGHVTAAHVHKVVADLHAPENAPAPTSVDAAALRDAAFARIVDEETGEITADQFTHTGEMVDVIDPVTAEVTQQVVSTGMDWRDARVLLVNVNGNTTLAGLVMKLGSGSYNAYRTDTKKPSWFATHQAAVEWVEAGAK